jgi:membrane-bound lytic murein transglycosylase D
LQQKLKEYDLPDELLAVPLMESGYANIPQDRGIAARGCGSLSLRQREILVSKVGQGVDERLDVEMATDSALRYLNALYLRFKDWRLAIMAYNAGEGRIQRGINETGSRDPWSLVEAGL